MDLRLSCSVYDYWTWCKFVPLIDPQQCLYIPTIRRLVLQPFMLFQWMWLGASWRLPSSQYMCATHFSAVDSRIWSYPRTARVGDGLISSSNFGRCTRRFKITSTSKLVVSGYLFPANVTFPQPTSKPSNFGVVNLLLWDLPCSVELGLF